jgi:hypothetical protein
MSNDEQKFEQYVDSLRFDDAPSAAHRDKLEKQLLDAYDTQAEYGDYVEPVAVYFRKLAIAAGFLIVAGVLFWAIDKTFISRDSIAQLPDQEGIQKILESENATGTEKKKLLTQIHEVGTLIDKQDTEQLVTVVKTQDFAYAVRTWAAKWLGRFGNENTLASLEAKIHSMNITDPDDPLVIAAEKMRQRLQATEPNTREQPGMQSLENEQPQSGND